MVFFLSNMLETQFLSTGAFEITLNGNFFHFFFFFPLLPYQVHKTLFILFIQRYTNKLNYTTFLICLDFHLILWNVSVITLVRAAVNGHSLTIVFHLFKFMRQNISLSRYWEARIVK